MIAPEGLSVPALLDAAARQDREAAVFPGARASAADLSALSWSYARALVSLGAGPGDHVGALLPAGLGVVALIHAGQFEPGAALAQLTAERVTHAFPAYETIWMPVLNHPDFPAADLFRLTTVINVGTPERMRFMQDRRRPGRCTPGGR